MDPIVKLLLTFLLVNAGVGLFLVIFFCLILWKMWREEGSSGKKG